MIVPTVPTAPPRAASHSRTVVRLLTGLLLTNALILMAVWKGDGAARAHAEIPDGGVADRRLANEELRALNARMERMVALLESGRLQVHVAPADDNKAGR